MAYWFERTETPRVFRLKGSAGSASPVAWSICTKRNVGLKTMALTAMANLGGQATSNQLREEIERMPESSRLSSETRTGSQGSNSGKTRSAVAWPTGSSARRHRVSSD